MTEEKPVACSLGPRDLEERLAAIAVIGADSLLRSETDGERHLLHFRSDPTTRRRLEELIAAEAECCPFLAFELSEQAGGELRLTVSQAG
jgi:hypothetical protein